MKKRLCVVTGSRAEYSSCRPLLEAIKADGSLSLQIVVTGMHLAAKFGLTYREIERDGYRINEKVPTLLFGDSEKGIAKSIGLGITRFAGTFARLKPDMVLLIGDRFETFAAAVPAFVANIPIAHVGGGDLTNGAMDDVFRHSITKMSSLHFVSAAVHRKRVIQLGEDPRTVFAAGAPCIDKIKKLDLLTKRALEKDLSIRLGAKNVIVTFHPATLERNASGRQFMEILKALDRFEDLFIIFTKPNSDTDSEAVIKLIDAYVMRNPGRSAAFKSLGQLRYLSLLKYVDAMVGNSSSGIVEMPLFGKPAINVGSRQDGRIRARSVIDCEPEAAAIYRAMRKAFSAAFRRSSLNRPSLYGNGSAAPAILRVIKERIRGKIDIKKRFYDIPGKFDLAGKRGR